MTTPQAGSWRPARQRLEFSDYGEWLDEGTNGLLEDIAGRAQSNPSTPSGFVRTSDVPFELVHEEDRQSYGAWLGDERIADLIYKRVGGRIVLWSVTVEPEYRNKGVATELTLRTLDDIRASKHTVTIVCPVVRTVIDHHPQYEVLVDLVHPGVRHALASDTHKT